MNSLESDAAMPWIEKYRPSQFDDIVLDPLNRTFFRNIIEKNHFSNLLFYGPPGTGKTTTIINLINEYQDRWSRRNKESVIHLNASDERGIDIIRTQIHQFVKSKHIFEVGMKFVILDEVDYMTKTAQQALKTLLQTCKLDVRFCLICNYISKIDESLQAEFICVRFNQLPNAEIHQFIRTIAQKEDIVLSDDKIDMIREMHQSDIRSMINFLQSMCVSEDTSIKMIQARDWQRIHKMMVSGGAKEEVLRIISDLSVRYNVHLKNIMHQYLNYVIRKHPGLISSELLDVAEKIVHATDDFPIQHLLSYFAVHLSKCISSG
jgi:replication factor C subunit 3/5